MWTMKNVSDMGSLVLGFALLGVMLYIAVIFRNKK